MHKDNLINNLHELYRQDPYINGLYSSIGLELDKVDEIIKILRGQIFFDQLTKDIGIPLMEKLLNFRTDPNSSLQDRQSQVEARWKSYGKFSIDLLQSVCNSWKNGEIAADIGDGELIIKFVGEYGIPVDMDNLQKAINIIKPAQFIIAYSYRYYLIQDIDNVMTLENLETQTLDKFAF